MEKTPSDIAQEIITTILFYQTPDMIGAALADIMARYLHGHQCTPRDWVKENKMRHDILDMWLDKVWELVALLESQDQTKQ